MIKLLAVFAAAMALAYISEQNTKATIAAGHRYVAHRDWAYVLLVTSLVLFTGLRTSYNDTATYIAMFRSAPGTAIYFSDAKNYNLLSNPLFYLILNMAKDFTDNPHIFILIFSLFTQICFVRFLKRYSSRFVFSIFIYFTLGTFCLTLAATKQVTAMAMLTLAVPFLEKKQWVRFYLIVFLAMLMHTYAMAFAILPLFTRQPWKLFTFAFAAFMVVMLMNFQEIIASFLEQADELGKSIAEYEVFDNTSVNIFRLAVYAVMPLMSLIFQKWIYRDSDEIEHVLIHMSIISLAFMSMGTRSGANMFGRMANYFELGTICCLPTILDRTFEKKSHKLVASVACACFLGFFIYANAINGNFDAEYQSISLFRFIISLFG